MTFSSFLEPTLKFFVFENIVSLIIISSCFLIYLKTKELFKLSLQKGLRYFSYAFLAYTITFVSAYIKFILIFFNKGLNFPLIHQAFAFIGLYTGALGGFYLAYSLIWRKFEIDRIKKSHLWRVASFHLISLIIAVTQIHLIIKYNAIPLVFYSAMILSLIFSIITNKKICKKERKTCEVSKDPFLSCLVLALGVYILMFIESIFIKVFPAVLYYVWGLVAVFFHTVYHNVNKITKGEHD